MAIAKNSTDKCFFELLNIFFNKSSFIQGYLILKIELQPKIS